MQTHDKTLRKVVTGTIPELEKSMEKLRSEQAQTVKELSDRLAYLEGVGQSSYPAADYNYQNYNAEYSYQQQQ